MSTRLPSIMLGKDFYKKARNRKWIQDNGAEAVIVLQEVWIASSQEKDCKIRKDECPYLPFPLPIAPEKIKTILESAVLVGLLDEKGDFYFNSQIVEDHKNFERKQLHYKEARKKRDFIPPESSEDPPTIHTEPSEDSPRIPMRSESEQRRVNNEFEDPKKVEIRNYLESVMARLPGPDCTAAEFHDVFCKVAIQDGFEVVREVQVDGVWPKQDGRIDCLIKAEKFNCYVELDRKTPRVKSVLKLAKTGVPGFVMCRETRDIYSFEQVLKYFPEVDPADPVPAEVYHRQGAAERVSGCAYVFLNDIEWENALGEYLRFGLNKAWLERGIKKLQGEYEKNPHKIGNRHGPYSELIDWPLKRCVEEKKSGLDLKAAEARFEKVKPNTRPPSVVINPNSVHPKNLPDSVKGLLDQTGLIDA